MNRIITLRYAAKCHVCGKLIAQGSRAYWTKTPKSQTTHIECQATDNSGNVPVPVKRESVSAITVDYTDVRDAFLSISESGYAPFSVKQKRCVESISRTWKTDAEWTGCSIPEMRQWIADGYHVSGLDEINSSLIAAKPRRKLRFTDEGDELHLDLAWSGADNYFSEWEKRVSKPGLIVDMEMAYSAANKSERIRPYLTWLARMLQTFDENAIDVEASLMNAVGQLTDGRNQPQRFETRIRVKRPGEASDFAAWSACVSPGGFRQLMFTAKIFHGDKRGESTSSSLGIPQPSRKWDIEYDRDENRITVRQSQTDDFPEFDMTQKLGAIIREITGQ